VLRLWLQPVHEDWNMLHYSLKRIWGLGYHGSLTVMQDPTYTWLQFMKERKSGVNFIYQNCHRIKNILEATHITTERTGNLALSRYI
jgi:hypothetical protein